MTDYRDFYRELRTDWLRLRGYLYDLNTQLPALPVVLDEVRGHLESGEQVGVLLLSLGGGRAEARHGWQSYDEMIQCIARAVRKHCGSLAEPRTVAAQSGVRSDEILVFVSLGGGGDAEAALESLRSALVVQVQEALVESVAASGPPAAVFSAAQRVRLDPKVRIERSIYRTVRRAREACRRADELGQSRRLAELRRILGEGDILTRYQPIVRLTDGDIHGFEALSAAPRDDFFADPEVLFSFAEESEALLDLERLCRRQATRGAVALLRHDSAAAGGKLFINCSARAFADPELPSDLAQGALAAGLDPNDLVIEVTERVAITEWQSFRRTLRDLRNSGLRVAIDDMGAGYSSLHAVTEIQPDYLKFDFSLIHGIHRSSIKRDLLETLLVMADKFGAQSIAEGIESEEEFETVREMGVPLGQGFFLAAPAPPSELGCIVLPPS